MLQVKSLIRFAVLLLVIVSGILLGLSLGNVRLMMIAIIGATLGFLLADFYKVFRLDGILANIASVGILVLAMRDFLPGDSTVKLLSVANLLVYLQTVLMFQLKTPRLIWQILVLSLLQVVVAAIFSLDFEGGIFFLLYFVIAAATLVLQAIYSINFETTQNNQQVITKFSQQTSTLVESKTNAETGETTSVAPPARPILLFDPDSQKRTALNQMAVHLSVWMTIGLIFTSIMFYMIPRHTKPWFGPNKIEVPSTGFSKSVDLMNRDRIRQTNQLIFRATFEGYGDLADQSLITQPPYFRGMALSHLVIENGRTNWRAPNDRINDSSGYSVYQGLLNPSKGGIPVRQIITMEENSDCLVHAVMPVFQTSETTSNLEFCHEVSGLTRCRISQEVDLTPYKYELGTYIDERGHFNRAWPYLSNHNDDGQLPMSEDPPQQRWLTYLDKSRYPRLVKNADMLMERIKTKNPTPTRREIIEAFENYFAAPERFRYTLDFTNVEWNEGVDPVEDFVANHRRGHCELFASAMTLMLRSQGIPARLVVGFHGGDYNAMAGSFMVRGRHAHAWVEAYLRPEDCTPEMVERGEAGPGGAWLLADPTPTSFEEDFSTVGGDAIDLARSMWQDYVLGMDAKANNSEASPLSFPMFEFLQNLDLEKFNAAMTQLRKTSRTRGFRFVVPFVIIAPFVLIWIVSRFRRKDKDQSGKPKPARGFRRLMASAISLISPSLGKWVLDARGSSGEPTAFYRRMTRLLASRGLEREPSQTHREFALEVSRTFSNHPRSSLISSTVREITELFNDVRFGKQHLPEDLQQQIGVSLKELEEGLAVESGVVENRAAFDQKNESRQD